MKNTLHLSERSYFIVAVGWTLLISYLCLTTIKKEPIFPAIAHKDKVLHFLFYFVFVICWSRVFKNKSSKKEFIIVVIAVLYGIIIEVLQSIVTVYRQADVYDALANAIGALAAFLFLRFYKNKT